MAATPETLGSQERLLSQEGSDSDRKLVQQCGCGIASKAGAAGVAVMQRSCGRPDFIQPVS